MGPNHPRRGQSSCAEDLPTDFSPGSSCTWDSAGDGYNSVPMSPPTGMQLALLSGMMPLLDHSFTTGSFGGDYPSYVDYSRDTTNVMDTSTELPREAVLSYGVPNTGTLYNFIGIQGPDISFNPGYPSRTMPIMSSPKPVELLLNFPTDTRLAQWNQPSVEPQGFAPMDVGSGEYMPASGPYRSGRHGPDVKKTRRASKASDSSRWRQSTASADHTRDASFSCCDRKIKSKSSFDRHRKAHCKLNPATASPFRCDPLNHNSFSCPKSYSRRCGLKAHYRAKGLSEKDAYEKVKEQYPKGMHSRRSRHD